LYVIETSVCSPGASVYFSGSAAVQPQLAITRVIRSSARPSFVSTSV